MKNIFKISIIILPFVLLTSLTPGGPCGSDSFLEACAPELGDYTFLKTFDVVPAQGEKKQVSYIMSKGSKYRIVVCDEDTKGHDMKVKLLDRKKKMIATNYLSDKKKYYPSITFTCPATGVYYMEASFKSSIKGCGVIILGFTK